MKKSSLSLLPVLFIAAGIILIVISVIWFQSFSDANLGDSPSQADRGEVPFPEVPRVRLQDAQAAAKIKTAVLIDVRSREIFDAGHIPGSISIPENELSSNLATLNPNDWIITYCT